MSIDFEAEGLLRGVDDLDARVARLDLLRHLEDDGCSVEQLRQAVEEGRLALLPVERALTPPGRRLTASQIAEESGVELEFIAQLWRAYGLAPEDPEAPVWTEADLDTVRRVKSFRDAGIDDEGILEVTRVLGRSMGAVAASVRDLIAQAMQQPGDTEHDLALRWAEGARTLAPQFEPIVLYAARVHQLEAIRHEAVDAIALAAGEGQEVRRTAIGFADLVGFTRLGEEVGASELGVVADRLSELAADVVMKPVQLVKTIGDAVMLASPEPDPLLDALLGLVDAADAEGARFPQLRAGADLGDALRRASDWYGPPVNLAARMTSHARAGSVLVSDDLHEAANGDYRFTRVGRRRFKGIAGDVLVHRVRRAEGPE